jgi:N-acetylglucosaminyldiphosphoundecaprenol N-acetyl-beta-D-mannosaminyltransferase
VWASRVQKTPLRGRVAFSEMIYPLARAASEKGRRMFLLGGEPGIAERAAESLRSHAPGIVFVGSHAPPFGFEDNPDEMARVIGALERAAPDIVVCSFGCPKQERLMAKLAPRFSSAWFIGAGGTLTIVSGETPHAPEWMRRTGIEWVHRLRLEPRRLFKRYVVHDIPFACRLFAVSLKRRYMPVKDPE